jgi:hypothetical protein
LTIDKAMQDERRKQVIEIWKTIVEVQQHFNDISMRIRGMFVTILLALFASIGFLLDKQLSLDFGSVHVRFATLIPLFGIVGTLLFYFIDRYWYHRLLVGSVNHAIAIEKKYKDDMPELSLSDAIGAVSPYKPGYIVNPLARLLVRHEKYRQTRQLHSDGKIELFYKSVILVLILTMIMLAYAGGVTFDKTTQPARADSATSTVTVAPRDLCPASSAAPRHLEMPAARNPSQSRARP